jgi:transcriptional regulator with XRE-family HTH domain
VAKKLSVCDVAKALDLTRSYVSAIETGKTIPNHGEKYLVLCEFYKLDPIEIGQLSLRERYEKHLEELRGAKK